MLYIWIIIIDQFFVTYIIISSHPLIHTCHKHHERERASESERKKVSEWYGERERERKREG